MKRAHPYSYYTSPGGIYGDQDENEEVARKRRLVSSFEGLSLSSGTGQRHQQQRQQHQRVHVSMSPALSSPASTPPTSPPPPQPTSVTSDSDADIDTDTEDDGIILSSHVPNLILDNLLASMTARRYADPSKPGADPTRGIAGNRYVHFYERWWTTALVPRATVFAGAPDARSLVWARFAAYLAQLQNHNQEGADYDYIGDCDVDMDLDDDHNEEAAAGYAYAPPSTVPCYRPDNDDYDDDDNLMDLD